MAMHSVRVVQGTPQQVVAQGEKVLVGSVTVKNAAGGSLVAYATIKTGGSGGTTVWEGGNGVPTDHASASHSFPLYPLVVEDGLHVTVTGDASDACTVNYDIPGEAD